MTASSNQQLKFLYGPFSVYWYILHIFDICTQNEIMNCIYIFGKLCDKRQTKMLYVKSYGRIIPETSCLTL